MRWQLALTWFASGSAALSRVDKTDGDFATDVDLASEAAMRSIVRQRRPGDAILGEEMGRSGPVDADRVWLLDPLCGTFNYAAGTGLVAVNAALVEAGRVVSAAVADPFGGELAWTDGRRAWLGRGHDRTLARPSGTSVLLELNFDPPFPNASWFSTARLAADAVTAHRFRPRVLSTTLGLAWVAMGHRAAYVTDGYVRDSVHFAAGIGLCEAAGCVVTDLTGS
jgi:myo-inositol-1(or 4)-monophosphatase